MPQSPTVGPVGTPLPFDQIRTASVAIRRNLISIETLLDPATAPVPPFESAELEAVGVAIVAARAAGRPVIWSMGAHVIKNGLSCYVIDLVRQGWITHVAGNGACAIHDFELAMVGATAEDVATNIEDGSFGNWEETGRLMNQAIAEGAGAGLGCGESLARFIDSRAELFPHRGHCLLSQTAGLGVPYTVHLSVGTDIIQQHPSVDFTALGATSGLDFVRWCQAVAELEGGVLVNFGSAVSAPHLFVRALAAAHNRGRAVRAFTAANFDLRPGRGTTFDPAFDRANVDAVFVDLVGRVGGRGYCIEGLHQATVPNLHSRLTGARHA